MIAQMTRGTVEGTGAALNVSVGFVPDYVKVFNIDAGTKATLEWTPEMGAGGGWKEAGTSAPSVVSSNGISVFNGDLDNSAGFTLGTDAINGSGETLLYVAIRSGMGVQNEHYVA